MYKHLLAIFAALIWCFLSELQAAPPVSLPLLPNAVSNFGAAELDGWLYVYGGHDGPQEEHSARNLSNYFVRCRLSKPLQWEELEVDRPLHSLALVGCDKYLFRIGGAAAIDEGDSAGLLHSVDTFARFDPVSNKWKELPPLPAARSSHDAIAADGKIYVIGGWHVEGDTVRDWHDLALVFDTRAGDDSAWQSLPVPSFRRRNLAVTTWQNCIWAIGGRDDDGADCRTVFYFDLQRGYWSQGPELPMPASGMQGYGIAAVGTFSGLYTCGADGVVYRLSEPYGDWEPVANLRVPRYCHRLLPDGENALLALAGHSVSFGPTRNIERVRVNAP